MELKTFKNYGELSVAAATVIVDCIKNKPDALICLATGDTPKLAYQLAVETITKEKINTSRCFFTGLDEWLGVPPHNSGSCHHYLYQYFFNPAKIRSEQIHLFDAMSTDENGECEKMNRIIKAKNGVDLMVVGVGQNGHVGLNEPGTGIDTLAHVAPLEEVTKKTAEKYFTEPVLIDNGITIGLKQVMESGTLLMLANGKKKSPVIKRAMEGEVSTGFPASLIRRHDNAILMIDTEAASELEMQLK